MKQSVLTINHLTVQFAQAGGQQIAVNDLSLQINAGEVVALVGESGSGKSITALSLMQLLPAQAKCSGEIIFTPAASQPLDLLKLDDKAMRSLRGAKIAMIFQEPMTALNPLQTCGNQVVEIIRLHQQKSKKRAKEDALQLFAQMQLPHPDVIFDKYPHQISGGQKQRVIIAMAVSCNPDLLIADEPTTALDVTVQKSILTLLAQISRERGLSVLLITHDLGLVADYAHQVAVMYRGSLVEMGSVSEVLNHPSHRYTQALLACRPQGKTKGVRLPVVADFMNDGNTVGTNQDVVEALSNMQQTAVQDALLQEVALQVNDLRVHYTVSSGRFWKKPQLYKAVDGVSFEINRGETVGLVGESGCGKTTLGRAILQLLPITSGDVRLNGQSIKNLKGESLLSLRKELQVVFQDPYGSLNPRLTVSEAIIEPMLLHRIGSTRKQRRDMAAHLFEQVNLKPDQLSRYPHQFSGGQRQRICIARALALSPSVIIFDESVSALDVSVQAQVLNLLDELKKKYRFTSLFISHDLSVVKFISDKILVMQAGVIVESGNAEAVYDQPQHPYTQQLIAAIPGKKIATFC